MNMELKTKRLVLRELKDSDAQSIVENVNNVNVSKYLLVVPYPYSLKDAEEFIGRAAEKAREMPRTEYDFGITLNGEKNVIGIISIEHIDMFHETGTIGYWLGEKYWRNKYMTEALERVVSFGFDELKLRRININAFAENEGSIKLIERAGFVHEGTRREKLRDKATGTLHDDNVYGLLRKEYEDKKARNS